MKGKLSVVAAKKSSVTNSAIRELCPNCALCCNGVLFKDVELQPGDSAKKLEALGVAVKAPRSGSGVSRFSQPCVALEGCQCRIYVDRPARCRQFECALLKSVAVGETKTDSALRTIKDARKRAEKVRGLLQELGDRNESLALSLRFKRMQKAIEKTPLDDDTAEVFSRLTLAVHDLNFMLQAKFYPA